MRPENDPDAVVVLTTMPDEESAGELATKLVEERAIACANIVPRVTSVYRWDEQIRREGESLLVLKTTAERGAELRERLVALHPYDVPEVLVLPVRGGHAPYLAWVAAEVAG